MKNDPRSLCSSYMIKYIYMHTQLVTSHWHREVTGSSPEFFKASWIMST